MRSKLSFYFSLFFARAIIPAIITLHACIPDENKPYHRLERPLFFSRLFFMWHVFRATVTNTYTRKKKSKWCQKLFFFSRLTLKILKKNSHNKENIISFSVELSRTLRFSCFFRYCLSILCMNTMHTWAKHRKCIEIFCFWIYNNNFFFWFSGTRYSKKL